MTTFNGTPGPLSAKRYHGRNESWFISGPNGETVCGGGGNYLNKTNAVLFAAAPDLLEALTNLLAVNEGKGGTKYHAQDIARAAIAKALGHGT